MEGYDNPKSDLLRLVHSWLCDESNGRWVMVVDNADDSDVLFSPPYGTQAAETSELSQATQPLSDFLPQSANGSILFTSRARNVAYRLTGSSSCILEVKPMDKEDALTLFRKKLGSTADSDGAVELLDALDHMPLAITQAAAYIEQRAPRMTISRYLDNVRRSDKDRARLLTTDVGDCRRDGGASNSILTTWEISFEHIRVHKATAARLLSLMSFFDRQGIPESLLLNRYTVDGQQADFEEDIHALVSYSLVRISENEGDFEMHRLVQFSTRKWLELNNELEFWKGIYIVTVAEALPRRGYSDWAKWQKLSPHAEVVMEYEPLRKNFLKWGSILHKAAWYALTQGQYRKAGEMVTRALDVRERALGEEHQDTSKSAKLLARLWRKQGKYKEAEGLQRRILKSEEDRLGLEQQATLNTVEGLGQTLRDHGKYEEAEAMHRRVLKGREKTLGVEHLSTLFSADNLGVVLRYNGKYEEAEAMHRRALKGIEKALGAEDQRTVTSLHNLAVALSKLERWQEAQEIQVGVLETRKRLFGVDHRDTLRAMKCLAITRKAQGHNEEALILTRTCVEMRV